MSATAKFIQVMGEEAIETIAIMQKGGLTVLMRVLESYAVPADFAEFSAQMRAIPGKVTATQVRHEAGGILRRRWWNWNLMHPELCNEGLIHPSRSVHPLSLCLTVDRIVFFLPFQHVVLWESCRRNCATVLRSFKYTSRSVYHRVHRRDPHARGLPVPQGRHPRPDRVLDSHQRQRLAAGSEGQGDIVLEGREVRGAPRETSEAACGANR